VQALLLEELLLPPLPQLASLLAVPAAEASYPLLLPHLHHPPQELQPEEQQDQKYPLDPHYQQKGWQKACLAQVWVLLVLALVGVQQQLPLLRQQLQQQPAAVVVAAAVAAEPLMLPLSAAAAYQPAPPATSLLRT